MTEKSVVLIVVAVIGLIPLLALLVTTVILARAQQPMWAAFTGSGAVVVGLVSLYKLLTILGQSA